MQTITTNTQALALANRQLNTANGQLRTETALTIVQYLALDFVAQHEGLQTRALVDYMDVQPTVVTGVVDRLVRDGLVQRFTAPTDRRCFFLRLTELGRRRYATAHDLVEALDLSA